eukprot:GHRR01037754.1.p1 GENE.GHRR01037754.1~~GHRR01037754.1.p1  ORF type:complete len:144 (-),score=16.97 GHRR01037754.1:164-595(-)
MHKINQIGGTAVANSRVWRRFDHVTDVAGGVGGFMADILDLNLHLRGVVFDQASQIESAHKVRRDIELLTIIHSLLQPVLHTCASLLSNCGAVIAVGAVVCKWCNCELSWLLGLLAHSHWQPCAMLLIRRCSPVPGSRLELVR